MPMMPPQSISLAAINAPTAPLTNIGDNRFRNDQERRLYSAYLAQLDVASELSKPAVAYYQDAWINLNLSVECFFKHIYCLIRTEFESFASPIKRWPMGPFNYDGAFYYLHKRAREGGSLTIKDFGHEIIEVWSLMDLFTDAHHSQEFQDLRSHIPSQEAWVGARYSVRNHPGFKAKYEDYRQQFDAARTTTFRRFK